MFVELLSLLMDVCIISGIQNTVWAVANAIPYREAILARFGKVSTLLFCSHLFSGQHLFAFRIENLVTPTTCHIGNTTLTIAISPRRV